MFIKHKVTDPGIIREWCQKIDLGHKLPLLALGEGRILGCSTLHQQLGGWKRHIGRVSVLVHPLYRGRGLARLLVGEVTDLAHRIGLEKLEAEFLAIVLVLVYVGAVMVLFLFVVMMLDVNVSARREGFTRYAPVGAIVAGIIVFELLSLVWLKTSGLPVSQELVASDADHSNTREIGVALYSNYVFEFELAAFVLLLAIVAAIVLTLRQRPGLKVQDVSAQVRVRREDRVRIVQVPAESDQ